MKKYPTVFFNLKIWLRIEIKKGKVIKKKRKERKLNSSSYNNEKISDDVL
jgi:hypothetical protein